MLPSTKADSDSWQGYALEWDSRQRIALTPSFLGISVVRKQKTSPGRRGNIILYIRQGFPLNHMRFCDFKQIFAVWQGYDLFAKASCNPFNRRVAPSYWIKHPGTGSACQSGEGQSKTITYERNRYDGQRFIGSHESGSATFTVLLLAQPRRRCKPIGETRALAGLGFQCGMKAARFSGTVQHLWRLSPVISPSIRW